MQPWAETSEFAAYLDRRFPQRLGERKLSSTNQAIIHPSDNRCLLPEPLLSQGIRCLNELSSAPHDDLNRAAMIRQLRDALHLVSKRPVSGWSMTEQYRLLHPFSSWMTRYSISFVDISNSNETLLATLANFYAVGITLVIVFPALDILPFASIRLKGIIEIDQLLRSNPGLLCGTCSTYHYHNKWLEFPLNAVHTYQSLSMDTKQAYV